MKLAVLMKQVPDSQAVRMDDATGTLLRDAASAVTNPLDLYALAAALRLAREIRDVSITVIGMGPKSAEKTLREAIALGADDAFLICDKRCAGSDTLATSLILAAALEKFGPFDLVLTGLRAADGETGQVGPETAARLGIPPITYVEKLSPGPDGTLEAERKTETAVERIRFRLPALVSVTKGIGGPGLPTLDGKRDARRRAIPNVTAEDLGFSPEEVGSAASPTRVVNIFHPVLARHGEIVPVTDDSSLKHAVNLLTDFVRSPDSSKGGPE